MGWIIFSIAFIIITTSIIFLIAKMIMDSQLKKARRNYDEAKNESRKPELQDEFRRDISITSSKPELKSSTESEGRDILQNDVALDLREDKPELGISKGTKKPKKSIRRIFKGK